MEMHNIYPYLEVKSLKQLSTHPLRQLGRSIPLVDVLGQLLQFRVAQQALFSLCISFSRG